MTIQTPTSNPRRLLGLALSVALTLAAACAAPAAPAPSPAPSPAAQPPTQAAAGAPAKAPARAVAEGLRTLAESADGKLRVSGPASLLVSAGGTGYYGLYNAVNEAVTVQASAGASSGALTVLVEPKTAMPASASDAQTQLKSLFPGVTVTLAPVQAVSTAYVFYGTSGSAAAYSLGFVTYEELPLAYAIAGTGQLTSAVPKS